MEFPIKIILPWPPSVNTLYFQSPKHGQKFLSKKGKEYKKTVQKLYADDERKSIDFPVRVRIELFPPDSRDRDADNYLKAPLDALTDLNVLCDDSLIHTLVVIKNSKVARYNKGLALICIKPEPTRNRDMRTKIEQYLAHCNIEREDLVDFIKETKKNKI